MRWLRYLLAAAVVLYLLTGVVQVRQGERAVVRRFGRVLDEKPTPGLWVGLPWGMDRVERVEVDALRNVQVGAADRAGADAVVSPMGADVGAGIIGAGVVAAAGADPAAGPDGGAALADPDGERGS